MLKCKTDKTHQPIIDVLRDFGLSVFSTHVVGRGFPDAVAAYRGKNYLIEIKDGKRIGWRLTPSQKLFRKYWRAEVVVLDSVDTAINWVRKIANDTR